MGANVEFASMALVYSIVEPMAAVWFNPSGSVGAIVEFILMALVESNVDLNLIAFVEPSVEYKAVVYSMVVWASSMVDWAVAAGAIVEFMSTAHE